MRRTWTAAWVLCVAAALGGFTRAIKEGIGVVRGGKGVTIVIRPIATQLTEYGTFRSEPFEDRTGTGVPRELQSPLNDFFKESLANRHIPTPAPGERTLTICGTLLYYESARASVSQAISPIEEVVARVQLYGWRHGHRRGQLCRPQH